MKYADVINAMLNEEIFQSPEGHEIKIRRCIIPETGKQFTIIDGIPDGRNPSVLKVFIHNGKCIERRHIDTRFAPIISETPKGLISKSDLDKLGIEVE